jgi:hypothetical protein
MLAVLVSPHVPSCQLSWALNLVMKYGEIKVMYIMMVAMCNACV